MRIVSLVPSVTETLLEWGITPIAVTRFCEHPELPHVGGTKNPDVDAIVALAPDLVVMNDDENRIEDADALQAAGVPVHVVRIRSVTDVTPALTALATVCGTHVGVITPTTTGRTSGLRVFVPVWRRPWMTINADTYGSSLLDSVGVDNVYAHDGERYPTVDLDDVRSRAPDVVVAPSEPYPFAERHRAELETIAPVVFVDGRDLFWWGVRTPAAQQRLRELLDGCAG